MGILMETTEVNLGSASYRGRRVEPEYFGAMGAPAAFYSDTIHSIAINTRETEFGSIVEPIPITIKTYKQLQAHGHAIHGYEFAQQLNMTPTPLIQETGRPTTSAFIQNPAKVQQNTENIRPPPKKKWIKEYYLEEEPKSAVSVRVVTGLSVAAHTNGVLRGSSPVPVEPPTTAAAPLISLEPVAVPVAAPIIDFVQEHSRPRATSISHGPPQIPSPPSVGSNGSGSGSSNSGSAPRAGTREVHNKLEKNRRAHLKECFEMLKRQLPATPDDKKTSNLSILGSAIRYIQVLRRKERECEHEMERLAREKIAAQQRLAALKREVSVRATAFHRPTPIDTITDENDRDDRINGQVLGIPISINSSPPHVTRMEASSPPHTLNLSTKLHTLPIQITPTTSQVLRTTYGPRHNITLTTLAPAETSQNGQAVVENGITNTPCTLVHPAQIHLPISQVVGSGGLVVGPTALQLVSTSSGLRVLQAPVHTNGLSTLENNRLHKENGIISPIAPVTTEGTSVVVSGLGPIVVSQPTAHLLQTHTLSHKVVETQMVKGHTPLTVSTQYLSAATIVKPVVVVSSHSTPPT